MLFIVAFLGILLPLTAAFNGIDCSRVPPALWCRNDTLAQGCGVADACNKFTDASKYKPIQLTVLYESLCPDSIHFITESLYPVVYQKFSKYVDIELVPWGNANLYENGTIVCQHGPEECLINRFESCAIKYLKDPVPLVYCLEQSFIEGSDLANATQSCFGSLKVPGDTGKGIQNCSENFEGKNLQLLSAKRTAQVGPDAHEYVPWLVFNNVSLKEEQFRWDNFLQTVCGLYVGDDEDLVKQCEGLGAPRHL